MKKILLLAALCLAPGQALAALADGPDAVSKPEKYYSTNAEALDSLAVLPAPPALDSILFMQDQVRYREGKLLRATERGKLAAADADFARAAEAISEAFGCPITKEDTPAIHHLVERMRVEAGEMATRSAKRAYSRVRPYVFYNEGTCFPDDEEDLRHNGSYPSGHSACGWAVALVLSEINPDRREILLKRGYEMGQSRVICGYHWQSDVDAGRTAGAAAVAVLHANETFLQDLARAKEEFKALKAAGKIAQ